MRISLAGLALVAALSVLPAAVHAAPVALTIPSGAYVLDTTHASVTWRVMHFGLAKYTARFSKFDAAVTLDAADVSKSSLKVTIDPKSVRTDYPFPEKVNFDAKLGEGTDFLNAKAYPEITFVSTGIVVTGPTTANVTGNLTLLGVTKPVVLTTVFNGSMAAHPMLKIPVFGISARGTIKRSDFGMSWGQQFVGDAVELEIEAEFRKAQ